MRSKIPSRIHRTRASCARFDPLKECFCVCNFKLNAVEKFLPHSSQWNCFPSSDFECPILCCSIACFVVNRLSHIQMASSSFHQL
ncbi:hypothetical protein PMAYCL1PPCAC_27710 [Pristionchus mayeri]|uniref:Uncharacterized protein n=1 Tax=Pristionchus mayeri TaxID=1317129 RepID=A0AAN5D7K2_9BILA|nr:hypothetical protein PMAYCL1PPCAC_27710 [Pristionchus mayeri]